MNLKAVWEKATLLRKPLASKRTTSGNRRYSRVDDDDQFIIDDPFISDEAKLLSSKSFRMMKDKTQVFTFPQTPPLIRSRQSHVMEVVAVSVIASEMLGLNTNLVRAAAIGHDIGHVPFGHQGEKWMAKEMEKPFCHEVMGPITAQLIERKGKGLNLTNKTLEAMTCHSGNTAKEGMSQEAWLLRYTDKFAYIFHDINDIFVRMKYPAPAELMELANEFGRNQRERTITAIAGLVIESNECGKVSFQHTPIAKKFDLMRTLMYEVYVKVTQQDVEINLRPVLDFLHQVDIGDPFLLLALMTDKDVDEILRATMKDMQLFNRLSIREIAHYIRKIGKIDLCDPCLDWQ